MDPALLEPLQRLGIALLLGMLVGLQREHAEKSLAGFRTFALITVLGTLVSMLDQTSSAGGWVIAAGLLSLAVVVVATNTQRIQNHNGSPGMTTVAAIMMMFAVGAYTAAGSRIVAVALGAGVAALLQFKEELHGIAGKLGDTDLRAIMQFALFTCVILPVLPNQNMGPFQVLNPFGIWLMVVLIVGISLAGYITYRFLGRDAGVLLGGVLGGSISSTATTASYARRTATETDAVPTSAVVIMIASSISFIRVLIEIWVVTPQFAKRLSLPIAALFLVSMLTALVMWLRLRRGPDTMPKQSNPTELRSALLFGVLYAVVLLALAAAREYEYLGGRGLYAVAALSGMTDMDAITLSTARMINSGTAAGGISVDLGWRLIVVASLANLCFKLGIVAVLGNRELLLRVSLLFLAPLLAGGSLLWLWPSA